MVKLLKPFIWAALAAGLCALCGCNIDLPGLFGSTDLDIRLQDRNNLTYINTLPRPALGDAYSFIVMSDTHIEDGDAHGLEKLADIVSADDSIKFVVITGDITQYGARDDVEKFLAIARSLTRNGNRIPCYPVIGNHDVYQGNWPHWRDLIGSTNYRIAGNSGGASLLFLDSANAFFGKEQLDWLEAELKRAESRNQRVFVFTHVNLFVESLVDLQQFTDTRERARIISLLKGRADAMFMGHIHKRVAARELGGVQYITIEDYRDKRSYCLVSVTASGISWEFRKF